ncbi:TPA: hypothetical protein LVM22_001197 [Klebsiella oxytoca]|nr:hypothetical protein [Klebsiella oxytoca]
MKTKIRFCFRPGWRASLTARGVFYGLNCLGLLTVTGWHLWMQYPVTLAVLSLGVALLPGLLTAALVRAGMLRPGFYCALNGQKASIHLAPWTPMKSLTLPTAGRDTRDSLVISLHKAAERLDVGDIDEIVMASWMLSLLRIRRTLVQAGLDGTRYNIQITVWHAGWFRRFILQCVLLLTQWRWPVFPAEGHCVQIRRKDTEKVNLIINSGSDVLLCPFHEPGTVQQKILPE